MGIKVTDCGFGPTFAGFYFTLFWEHMLKNKFYQTKWNLGPPCEIFGLDAPSFSNDQQSHREIHQQSEKKPFLIRQRTQETRRQRRD